MSFTQIVGNSAKLLCLSQWQSAMLIFLSTEVIISPAVVLLQVEASMIFWVSALDNLSVHVLILNEEKIFWMEISIDACSHTRAPEYFTESINSPVGFKAVPCKSWASFMRGSCSKNGYTFMGDPTSQLWVWIRTFIFNNLITWLFEFLTYIVVFFLQSPRSVLLDY